MAYLHISYMELKLDFLLTRILYLVRHSLNIVTCDPLAFVSLSSRNFDMRILWATFSSSVYVFLIHEYYFDFSGSRLGVIDGGRNAVW